MLPLILMLATPAEAGRACQFVWQGRLEARLLTREQIEADEARRARLELRPAEPLPHGWELGGVRLLWQSRDLDWVDPARYTVVVSRDEQAVSRVVPSGWYDAGGWRGFMGGTVVPLGVAPPFTVSVVAGSAWSCRFEVTERGRMRARIWR